LEKDKCRLEEVRQAIKIIMGFSSQESEYLAERSVMCEEATKAAGGGEP